MTLPVEKRKRRIFLVDDHPLVREWLTNLINQQPDLTVCGESQGARLAAQRIPASKAEVAVVDISLKDFSGITLIKELKESCPNVAVLVLSMHDEAHYAERALRAGARGYIMKRETAKKVITGIRQVLAGKLYVSERLTELFSEKFVDGRLLTDNPTVEQLSNRELEVFQLLGMGCETRQIAERLSVSMKTIQSYCARMKEKLNLGSATELLRTAIRWNETKNSH